MASNASVHRSFPGIIAHAADVSGDSSADVDRFRLGILVFDILAHAGDLVFHDDRIDRTDIAYRLETTPAIVVHQVGRERDQAAGDVMTAHRRLALDVGEGDRGIIMAISDRGGGILRATDDLRRRGRLQRPGDGRYALR
jgi:hypothetical protein